MTQETRGSVRSEDWHCPVCCDEHSDFSSLTGHRLRIRKEEIPQECSHTLREALFSNLQGWAPAGTGLTSQNLDEVADDAFWDSDVGGAETPLLHWPFPDWESAQPSLEEIRASLS